MVWPSWLADELWTVFRENPQVLREAWSVAAGGSQLERDSRFHEFGANPRGATLTWGLVGNRPTVP